MIQWTIPNLLTLMRIALIPLLVIVYLLPFGWAMPAASVLFIIAGVTDWLDGYLARKLNQTTTFGAFLDPVADKLMVTVALVLLIYKHPSLHLLIPSLIIIGREITVSALREWMAELGKRGSVAVSLAGKIKTTVQIVAIVFLLWFYPIYGMETFTVGLWLLDIAAILTVISMIGYVRAALRAN